MIWYRIVYNVITLPIFLYFFISIFYIHIFKNYLVIILYNINNILKKIVVILLQHTKIDIKELLQCYFKNKLFIFPAHPPKLQTSFRKI